jgi:uncharacterized protein (DUF1778 family)
MAANHERTLAMCACAAYILRVDAITKEQKAHRFVARVSAADKQLFQRAATIEGRSMATFVIAHAREVARRIINQSNLIELNADESARFVETLLAPPRQPTSAMTDSIRAYRDSVKSDLG